MALAPGERPASAASFVAGLEAALAGAGGQAPAADRSEVPTPANRNEAPTAVIAPAERAGSGATTTGRRRGMAALIAAAVVLIAAGVGVVALLGGDDGAGDASDAPPVVVTGEVGKRPAGVAVGDRRIWVAVRNEQPAFGQSSVWVVNGRGLYRLGGGRRPDPIAVGEEPVDVAVDSRYVWVADRAGDSVTRFDPDGGSDGRGKAKTTPVGDGPTAIVRDVRSVWAANTGAGTVSRISPDSLRVGPPIKVGPRPSSIAIGRSAEWCPTRS